jgi:hypothetical protein
MFKVWLLNFFVGVPHICVRMFINANLVLLVICMSCFRAVFKYKGSGAKIFINYVQLLFVKFSGILGCLWILGCYTWTF